MGTIADKLTYLNGTKQAIKQAINEDFEVIDDNTTFREYADEISSNNAKYKDLIPKETTNATNTLDISNSSGLDKALVTQYGNTYQDSTTGKNLFDNVYGQTGNVYTKHINAPSPLGSVDCYPINLVPNTQYTLKIDMNGYQKTGAWVAGVCFENGNVISLLQLNSMSDITTTTFTTDSTGVVYVGQRYGFTYGETGRMDLFLQTAKIQLEKGSTATDYEPYTNGASPNPDYPQEIVNISGKSTLKDVGKNLLDISTLIDGFVSNNGSFDTSHTREEMRSDFITVEPNTTYTFKIFETNWSGFNTQNWIGIGEYSSNYTFIKRNTMTTTTQDYCTFTTSATAEYIVVSARGLASATKVQLEKGSATTYEPYQEQSFDLDLPFELCKIGDYKDRIYPLNDKWYLEKKIGKVVLDGSESWTLPQTNTNTLRFNCEQGLINGLDTSIIKIISNKFVNGKSPSDNDDYEHIRSAVKGYPNMIAICINKSRLSSQNINGFKTWLENNNIIVYYALNTPTTEEITESNYPTLYNQLNNIKLYEGVNHLTFTNESGLDVEFDITYYKDWKL